MCPFINISSSLHVTKLQLFALKARKYVFCVVKLHINVNILC
ncbi:hypothetical protein ALT721_560019 [Alteromonas alvinellae]